MRHEASWRLGTKPSARHREAVCALPRSHGDSSEALATK